MTTLGSMQMVAALSVEVHASREREIELIKNFIYLHAQKQHVELSVDEVQRCALLLLPYMVVPSKEWTLVFVGQRLVRCLIKAEKSWEETGYIPLT